MNPFHYAMTLTSQLYGVEMPEENWEELALIAWNLIGNKRYQLYKYNTCVQGTSVELPCNVDIIEAVTYGGEDWNNTTNYSNFGDINSLNIEEYIESNKYSTSPLYNRGGYAKYNKVGNTLQLAEPYGNITILYKGVLVDEDGLPEITDKEAMAIATYCAHVAKFKEGIMTNNANSIQIANALKAQWNVQCDQARVADYINQNEMNQILDAKTSWNRKIYNKSFHPLQ